MWVFFSLIITVHLFLVKAVPNFAAPLYQITQNQTHSFSYLPLSSETQRASLVMADKPFANRMCASQLSKFSVSTFLAFLFHWNSGRGKERRWRIQLRFKIIQVMMYLFIPVDTVTGDTSYLEQSSFCRWLLLAKTATQPVYSVILWAAENTLNFSWTNDNTLIALISDSK